LERERLERPRPLLRLRTLRPFDERVLDFERLRLDDLRPILRPCGIFASS